MHVDLFFNLCFNFLSVKTKINKKKTTRLILINLGGSHTLKRQKYHTWIAMSLNHFENDVIWTVFKRFLELHPYISVFWGFSWISMISEFSVLGIGLKTKTRKSRKVFIFGSTKFKCIWIYFLITILTFLGAKTKINKNLLNLINLDGLEAFKRQTPGTSLEIWVNHFEFDVIWRTSQLLSKLHSHNSVLQLVIFNLWKVTWNWIAWFPSFRPDRIRQRQKNVLNLPNYFTSKPRWLLSILLNYSSTKISQSVLR